MHNKQFTVLISKKEQFELLMDTKNNDHPKLLKHLPEIFKQDKNILMDCIQRDSSIFIEFINYKMIKEDPIFFLQAFRSNQNLLNQKNLPYEILHSIGLQ
eukprot:gene6481-10486_t